MKLVLIGKNCLCKLSLPQITLGNYWITDESGDSKLINVEGKNGEWKISSNEFYKIINFKNVSLLDTGITVSNNEDAILDEITLKEYGIAYIYIERLNEIFMLYILPVYEEKFVLLDISNVNELLIGSGVDCDIKFNSKTVNKNHLRIFLNNDKWVIENLDKRFGTFVNDTPVSRSTRTLLNGDNIFVMGFKIIIIGKQMYISNPYKNVTINNNRLVPVKLPKINDDIDIKEDAVVYTDEKYYTRTPRIINKIEREHIKIDPPPAAQSTEKMPALLVMGSSMLMGFMSVLSMTNTLGSLSNGGKFTIGTLIQILMSLAMMSSMVLIPIVQRKYDAKQKKKYEEKRQKRYREYIDKKIKEIDDIAIRQKNILNTNFLATDECMDVILSKSPRLWERKIDNYDFLTVRLGTGDVPLDVDISYPEKSFTMEDDNLVEILNDVGKKSKILKNAPITLSLTENNITGIISTDEEIAKKFMKNLILQLVTFQSYGDLKLVFLLKEDNKKRWDYLKLLPHIWNNTKDVRFFTDNYDEMRELSVYLEDALADRFMYENLDYKKCTPYYLIITDDYRRIENLKIIGQVLKSKINVGVSLLCMADNLSNLPDESKTFINLENGNGAIFESEMIATKQKKFIFDANERIFFDKVMQELSNNPIKYNSSGIIGLPSTYSFMQMYDAGTVEQLNILQRWNRNDSTLTLRAPIGIDNTGMPIILDIHEKFHGPHGLIAGSTGSGKSEFLITYILSLAVNYHPNDVTFVLIDYKGGGLAGAFKKNEIKLPHLVGVITNIDTVGLRRSLASIQSELRRRQVIFNMAREKTNEGTIDIYKYQKLYHDGIVNEPISHLLIICDEFAELKQQQPEFMEELISVSRIGRSLGVHLILATQKPAGIVNDQIRSNSKFSICLKVQDKQDSYDVIKRPDAANLKNVGQFYMEVGNDEYFVLGQSAWAGAGYFPNSGLIKREDMSIEFISSIGNVLKRVDDSQNDNVKSSGEQLTNIVKYIYEIAKEEKIKTKSLWLDSIPETIYVDEVTKKYNIVPNDNDIISVCGEYDDPYNQKQGPVKLKFTDGGNILIYGSADSGKETLLSTMVYNLITSYSSRDIWLYLLDFGTEVLKIFKGAPHVGDVIFMNDSEKVERFFAMIQNMITERKQILSDYGGDYNLYINSGNTMPIISIIINNYEGFSECFKDRYDDIIQNITREGIKCGIIFIMTVSAYTSVRYRLMQNFKDRIALRLNNDDDYYNILENVGRKRPSNYFGRGLININGECYEFQTAKICESSEWNLKLRETVKAIKETNTVKAKPVPVMPEVVSIKDVISSLSSLDTVPIGISKKNLQIATYNFIKRFVNIITAKNIDDIIPLITCINDEINMLKNVNVNIIDSERIVKTKKSDFNKDYSEFINKLNTKDDYQNVCIVIGVDKLIENMDSGESGFLKMLKLAEEAENYNFILIEKASKFKEHEYETWYKSYVTGEDGIWVGSGADDQYIIRKNINDRSIINNCGSNYGYIIEQGELTMVKLVGSREEDENNE